MRFAEVVEGLVGLGLQGVHVQFTELVEVEIIQTIADLLAVVLLVAFVVLLASVRPLGVMRGRIVKA
ncbi:hypothetical protein [Mesorhizobium escarrei]|uniref:hypothetical protein n=1 Tax=Mesorhizobium escarrei TaxID=666018 RepID=UPI0020A7A506|nr:hypothetical protein [Mesorhizobium escarrei]